MEAKQSVDEKKPFHVQVAEKLIQQLEQGVAPWQKSWSAGETIPGGLPVNATTGKRYRGANVLQLMSQGYDDPRWCTYKQASSVGAQVRRGEHGTMVQYFKFTEEQTKLDEQGRPVIGADGKPVKEEVRLERPKVFHAVVFNAQQIDGLPALAPPPEQRWTPIERAEHILKASGADIRHAQQDRAYYRSSTDSIHMPEKGQFPEASGYYSTALHELGHWTGHSSRLDRQLGNPFGSEEYAKEELRAEIASMIIGETVGIGHDPADHAAYVGSWIKSLKEDPKEILRAAADAEKIHDYVMAFEQQQQVTQTQQPDQQAQEWTPDTLIERVNTWAATDARITQYPINEALRNGLPDKALEALDALPRDQQPPGTQDVRDAIADYWRQWQEANGLGPSITPDQKRWFEALPSDLSQLVPQQPSPEPARAIVLGTDSGTYYAGGSAPWTDDAREAQVFDNPTDAWRAAIAVQAQEAEALEDSAVQLQIRDPDNPRIADLAVSLADQSNRPKLATMWQQSFGEPLPADLPARLAATVVPQTETAPMSDVQPPVLEPTEPGPVQDAPTAQQTPELPDRVRERLDIWVGMAQGAADKVADIRSNDVLGTRYAAEYWMDARPGIAGLYDRIGNALGSVQDDANREAARKYLADRMPQSYVTPDEADFFSNGSSADLPPPAWARGPVPAVPPPQPAPAVQEPRQQDQERERTYIQVPYREKDEAKALGAKWDRGAQSWYVPGGGDLAKFEKWQTQARPGQDAPAPKPESGAEASPNTARQYLAVPYEERQAAKAAGAQWDKAAKSWYVGPNADSAKLERWSLDKAARQQGPSMTPREEFAEALTAIGCVVSGPHPIMDGATHRITVQGEAHSEKAGAGFYVGHLDGHPAGYMKNNKTGAEMKWKSKGYAIDPAEKAALAAEAASKLEARAAEQRRVHEQTAQRVGRQLQKMEAVSEPTPYMLAKGIEPQAGLFTDKKGKETVIPAIDTTGKLWTLQYVKEDGTKRFAKNSHKEGCFHPVGGSLEGLAKSPVLVIGEGYGTAHTLSKALGFSTVAAFDSGNLPAVAQALHQLYPDKPIVIAGDDDRHQEATLKTNPGRKKAEEAAQAVGGKAVFPIFAPGEQARDPKGFTDFNDMATKSALGIEGVSRQVRAVVDSVTEQRAAIQEQQQTKVRTQARGQGRDPDQQQQPRQRRAARH